MPTLALALLLCFAPAPLPRREKPIDARAFCGDYSCRWAGVSYDAWFRDDGTCGATGIPGENWSGNWALAGRTLRVTESAGGRGWTWDVELSAGMAGTATCRGDVDGNAGKTYPLALTRR